MQPYSKRLAVSNITSAVTGIGALGNMEGGFAACTLLILQWAMLNLSASLTVKGGSKEKQNASLSLEKIKINEVKQKRAYKANFMKLRIAVFFLSVHSMPNRFLDTALVQCFKSQL